MNKRIETKIVRLCDSLRENIDEMTDNIKVLKRTVQRLPEKEKATMTKQYDDILSSIIEYSKANYLGILDTDYKNYVT